MNGISETDERCKLKLEWNNDYTTAVISGYFDTGTETVVSQFLDRTISLNPYWRWKFASAVSDDDDNTMQDLDALCCPPKPGKDSCLGENKLGARGCETISDVCGPVLAENVSTCAMFKRSNRICISGNCADDISNYLVYPLADKDGKPTSYNDHYFSAIKDLRKVKTVFHGIERIQN